MKKHSLLQRFSLLSLAAFLIAGFVLGAILTSSIKKSAIDRAKNETAQFVAAEVDRVFPGMDFSLPMAGSRYEDFQKRVSHLLFNPSIKRIKVWNLDKAIVWSDERQLVGKRFPNDKELLEALNGTVSSEMISPDKPETRTESHYPRLLELYIPIRSERDGNVKAVVEIYQDLEYLDADTARLKRTLWISIVAGFSGIYFACFGIVWRASRRLTEQTLEVEKSEERTRDLARELTSLINNVPGIVYRGNRDWSLSFIGAEVEPVTGYSPDTFTSGAMGWKEIIHPDDMKRVKDAFRKANKEKADTLRMEYRIRNKDGGIRWIEDRRQLIYGEGGDFAKVDGLLLDITDRKRAEEAALQEKDFTLSALDSLPGLFYLFDEQGRFLRWNKNFEKTSGYSAEEISRMSPLDFFDGPDKEIIAEKIRQVFVTGEAGTEGDFLSKDQTRTPCFFTGKLFIFEQRRCLIGMGIDITERRRAEEAQRKSEREYLELSTEFHTILDVIPDNITRLSPDLKVIWANRATATNLEREPSELAGCHCYTLRHSLDRPYDHCPVLRSFRTGEPDYEIIRDSDNKTLEVRTVPVKEGGRVINVIEITRDITEQRKLERQLQTAQKMESVGTLAGGIAHDFNNVLTVIIGFGEMLKLRIANDPKAVSDLDEILRAAERASVLTRQLLTFARRQVVEPVNLDLNEVMTGLVKLLRKVTREDIEIKPFSAENSVMIRADRGQVEQVVMNLCLNARDAMPEGGELVIETGVTSLEEGYLELYPYMTAGRYAVLSVSDTGIGMDEETREHIFEPFFTTKGQEKGTGLGLAMVYGIVKQHDGFIHVYSEPGKGTTFRVFFPEVDAPADAKVIESQGVAHGGSETILLAEDNESVRDLTEKTLSSFGYKVLVACDGEEAVDIFRRHGKKIAMAVLDVVMPKMGGKQAYDEMSKTFPGMKVLFLSGYSADAIHESFVLLPGISFLQKPFGPNLLARKVREVLDRR